MAVFPIPTVEEWIEFLDYDNQLIEDSEQHTTERYIHIMCKHLIQTPMGGLKEVAMWLMKKLFLWEEKGYYRG